MSQICRLGTSWMGWGQVKLESWIAWCQWSANRSLLGRTFWNVHFASSHSPSLPCWLSSWWLQRRPAMCEAVGFTPLWCLIGPVCILAAAPGPPTAYRGNPRGIIPNHCHNTNPPLTISRPTRPASIRVLSRPTAFCVSPGNIVRPYWIYLLIIQMNIWWQTEDERVFKNMAFLQEI